MSIPKMAKAMGYIDDDLVSGAVEYKRTKKKNSWLKWGAMAACLCLVVVVAMPFMQNDEHVTDIEPYKGLTVTEAVAYEPYGELFPQTILDGYVLEENTVDLYDGKVMKAVYCNNSTEDVMTITISDKGYFENIELNMVLEKGQNGSKIYMDSGDYVVCYSFSTRDINTIEDFDKMVQSATAFGECLELPDIESISKAKAEEIALEQCKVNYDYIKTEFNSTEKRWYVEFWENTAKVPAQTILVDTEGNVTGIRYAE